MSETGTQEHPFRDPTALEPPEEWAASRQGRPVAPIRPAGGDEALPLTRYEDCWSPGFNGSP
jgi:hypothetical protein